MTPQRMTLDDWLDDLCVRFINNLPQADLGSMARICFQVEEAHWFYDDFIRPLDASLPAMSLRTFCLTIFKKCPLLAPFPIENHIHAFEEFLKYKTSIPVRGAILVNTDMDRALLVKGWKKGAHWSFPKGKINMNEDDLDCAIREVDEETGFDIRAAGLVPPAEEVKYFETTFRDQQIRLYVFRDVPLDTHFEPKTRKEIGGIQWYKIADLPTFRRKNTSAAAAAETDDATPSQPNNKFYMVSQFVGPLKSWIATQRKKDRRRRDYSGASRTDIDDLYTEDETPAPTESEPQPDPSSAHRPLHGAVMAADDREALMAQASNELRQMLHIMPQPARQPAVHGPDSYGPPDAPLPVQQAYAEASQDKANALLAVLQKGGSGSSRTGASTGTGAGAGVSVHTPIDHVLLDQMPPPTAPHHQHYHQPAQYVSQQQQQAPAPPFQLQMAQVNQQVRDQRPPEYSHYGGPMPETYQQHQAEYQQQQQARQFPQYQEQPQSQYGHRQQQQQPSQPSQYQGQPLQHYSYQQPGPTGHAPNPFAPTAPMPQQLPPPPSYMLQAGSGGPRPQPPAAAPIPLLHPQPLPPTVQTSLFARESLASPDTSAAGGAHGAERQGGGVMLPPPPPPLPLPAQHRTQQAAPLSSHAASLLSVFKSGDTSVQPRDAQPAPAWPQQQQQQQHPHLQQPSPPQAPKQQQQPYGSYAHGTQQPHGPRPQPGVQQPYSGTYHGAAAAASSLPGQGLSGSISSIIHNSSRVTNNGHGNPLSPRAPAGNNEQHLSSLLSMFRQTTSASEAAAPRPGAGVGVVVRANSGPTEMSAEPNLPLDALSLHGRPKGSDAERLSQRQPHQPHQPYPQYQPHARSQPSPASYKTPLAELPAATSVTATKAPATTILRKQPSIPAQTSPLYVGRQAMDSPGGGRPSTQGSSQAYGSVPRHTPASSATPAEGGPFAQAAPHMPPHQVYMQPQHQHQPHQQQQMGFAPAEGRQPNMEQRQKLLSLFSNGQQQAPQQPSISPMVGGVPSHPASVSPRDSLDQAPGALPRARRDSQTPISAEDRSFLFGYLANMSKT